jgi:uncharacterized protein YecT (DUF1311 family)
MAKLPEAASKQKLMESQRAWLAFRDAEAAFAVDEVRGGSMVPRIRYATMTELTKQRIKSLKLHLADTQPDEAWMAPAVVSAPTAA